MGSGTRRYRYTVRGFDEYDQFRIFFGEGDERIGLFASFDSDIDPCDFRSLTQSLDEIVDRAVLATSLEAEASD